MNSKSNPASMDRLKRRALSLGAMKTFNHSIQFLLPVLLVRFLDSATFGEYRLLWLAVGTVMTIATLNMCGTLYFFLPRSEPSRKRLYVHQTLIYLAAAGMVCGFLVSPANPVLPAAMRPLEQYGLLVPMFVALWVLGVLLDYLPTVDERISWQAYITVGITALRALFTGLAAWITGDFRVMLLLLIAVVLVKVTVLVFYVQRHHGLGAPWFEREPFSRQFRHSAPLGVNSAFFGLRAQADQWVAASLFAISSFAAFSIAAVVGQLMNLLRTSVMEAFLPSMSRLQAAGDVRGMLSMNSRGNVIVAKLMYPLLGFGFVFAPELVTLVYTASYAQAAPVVRVYILGMAASVVEIGSLVMLLRQGTYALRVTGFTLALSVVTSWTAAHYAGLAGAAVGSVLGIYLDRALLLRRLARLTGIPLRRLQEWRELVVALGFAVVTAGLAWLIVDVYIVPHGVLPRLGAGGAVFALAYAAAYLAQALKDRSSTGKVKDPA